MNEYQQFRAKTVDEAITKAMEELQTSTDYLEYEIVDRGSNGFLGIGARQAEIRARKKIEEKPVEKKPEAPVKKEKPDKEKNYNDNSKPDNKNIGKEISKEVPVKEVQEKPVKEAYEKEISEKPVKEAPVKEEKPHKEIKKIDVEPLIPKAEKFLTDVFAAMKIEAEITVKAGEDINSIDVDVSGEDMGVLIGKRGQTLDSLQYLTSIIVNAGQEDYIRVKVDTENYRSRRKETLENLAHNVAAKVKKTNRTVALEPMNPYERRVIHSALQQDKYVDTHSEGEEPYRKVVITPNKNCKSYNSKSYGNKRYHRNNNK